MDHSTNHFTINTYAHEIHGRVTDVLSPWSAEGCMFPTEHVPELVAALAGIASSEAPTPVTPAPVPADRTTPPAGFALNPGDLEMTGTHVYDGPQVGDVSTCWSPEDGHVTVYVDPPYGGDYTLDGARGLLVQLQNVVAALEAAGVDQ